MSVGLMLSSEPDPPNFDSMNILAQRSPHPDLESRSSVARSLQSPVSHAVSTPVDSLTGIHHHHHHSSSKASRQSRRSIAALAREKTSSAIANFAASSNSSPSLRSTTSSGSLSKHSGLGISLRPSLSKSAISSPDFQRRRRRGTYNTDSASHERSSTQSMARAEPAHGKMHQTSSKILRMTDDDRPFTKDFLDLFATLITSLPLTPHRVRFSRVEETFMSEEAITNLGSLKFSQSNRIPDPRNNSRWVVTTTTTTFSMAKEMARTVCQRFLDARLIESAESKSTVTFALKGQVWQLTPKGTSVLARFCQRNGINARHVEPIIRRDHMQLVSLERDPETDKLSQDKGTIEVIFRRFAGQDGPNIKSSSQLSDSDSVSDYATGLVGVKMAKDRRMLDKSISNSFTGKGASDWLMDCCTTVDRRETFEIAELFVTAQLLAPACEDKMYIRENPGSSTFQPTRHAVYTITEKGQLVCGWLTRDPSISSSDSHDTKDVKSRGPRDSNNARLNGILNDPALRLLFREFLRLSLCEENLTFYQDVKDFTTGYRRLEAAGRLERPDAVRETLGGAYGLYNAFLASGAPSELNIDHGLRSKLDARMIRTDNGEEAMRSSLREVVELFELAQLSVFKLMASDSVPKFMRDPRYSGMLREHEWEVSTGTRAFSPAPVTLPERSANRPSAPPSIV